MQSFDMINISRLAAYTSWLALLFPYFRLEASSYNQIYPLFPPIIYILGNINRADQLRVKGIRFYVLALVAVCSLGLFFATADSISSAKWLLAVLMPIVMIPVYGSMLHKDSKQILLVVKLSLIFWIIAAVIQICGININLFVVSPEIVSDSLNTGRGASSFAPEPTHAGFTFLIFAALLANIQTTTQKKSSLFLISIALASSLFLSKSSSSILAVMLSLSICILLWLLRKAIKTFSAARLCTPAYKNIFIFVLTLTIVYAFMFLNQSARFSTLINELKNSNVLEISSIDTFVTALSAVDQSLATRIGGIVFAMNQIVTNHAFPHGFSQELWVKLSQDFAVTISANGPPSGYISVIYYLGIFAAPLLVYLLLICIPTLSQRSLYHQLIIVSAISVFLFQFTIASPIFSALIASCLFSVQRSQQSKSYSLV
jgi:hypothetical protein